MSAVTTSNKSAPAPVVEEGEYPKLRKKLDSLDHDFLALLGTRELVDRFKRVTLNAVSANPKLLACNPRSLLGSAMKAAQDGLMPDGREAVFNIYNTKQKDDAGREYWEPTVQYLPMVAGLVKKMYEAGATYVDAAAVYERDHFVYERGDAVSLVHRPFLGADPGEIVAAYVVVKLATGEVKREVMPRRDIDKVRGASKTGDKGPWKDWFDQMAIKSVIKRAYKQLPNASHLDDVVRHDNEAIGFQQLDSPDEPAKGTAGLRQALGMPQPPAAPPASDAMAPSHTDVSDSGAGGAAEDGASNDDKTPAGPPFSAAIWFDAMRDAKTQDRVDELMDLIASYHEMPDVQKEMRNAGAERAKEITAEPAKKK